MITMAPNSSREANAAASCKIVHNRECFRMMFARCSAVVRGLRTGWLFASLGQTLNRLLPNLISNYLLTLTDGSNLTLRISRPTGVGSCWQLHDPLLG